MSRFPAAIFDFALYFFHNAKALLAHDTGPYFYLPKIESHLEARLWNEVFVTAQRELGVPQGTIKATVLIETVLAAFEMDEILYELREHCVGLNIGRWDYIFSCIKKFRSHRDFCLADRAQVTMTAPFMRAYALLLIKTCHRRNAFAMGGMAAQIPIKNDPAANAAALEKVRADKSPRSDRRLRRHLGRTSGPGGAREGGVRPAHADTESGAPEARRRDDHGQGPARLPAREADYRSRAAQQHQCRHPVHRRLARGQRLRAGLQPDGGRRHRRDLPLADLAVDPQPERASSRTGAR